MDIRTLWESTTQWTLPVTQDTAPQGPDRLRDSSAQTLHASRIFSPYSRCQSTSALAEKHHHPPAFNSKVFLLGISIS